MNKIKILLADDHPLLRQGIRELLERQQDFEVIGEAGDGEEAVSLTGKFKPHVIVMDIGMPKMSGLEATRQIKAKYPTTAVLVLTIHDEDEYLNELLEAGATGYLLKSVYGDELVSAIRLIQAGDLILHPVMAEKILKYKANAQSISVKAESVEVLTKREVEVLKLAARGQNNREIAAEMNIGVRTVKSHLVTIFSKMEVKSRTEAVMQALRNGWITLDDDK